MAEAMIGAAEAKVGALRSLDDVGIRCVDDQLETGLNHDFPDWRNPSQTWMIPPVFEMKGNREERGQHAEKKFFDLLHDFGNYHSEPMFVVHSYNFSEKISNWINQTQDQKKYVKGEHDFVLVHRLCGIIFFQVKGSTESTKKNQFASARKQLEKDMDSLLHFTENELKGELKKKMKAEMSRIKHMYVVMPNLARSKSVHGSNGVFMEEIENVEAFSKWWKSNILPRQTLDPEVYNCLVMRFVGLVHCTTYPLSSSIERSNRVLVWKTAEQLKVLLSSSAEQWVSGPAGSGKTWVLIEKVKQLGASRCGERILVVCFNRPLSKMLEKQFKDFSSVVEVKTFLKLLYEFTGKKCYSDREKEESISLAVKSRKGKVPEYDHVFVDECQDLIGDKWPVLFQKLWKGNEDDSGTTEVTTCKYKWFFYDTNQYVGWSEECFQRHKKALVESTKLTRVLRNTGNIFDQSKKYLQPSTCSTEEITLGHEEWGLNIKWKDSLASRLESEMIGVESVVDFITDVRNKGVSDGDICVLVENRQVRERLSCELKGLNVDNQNAEEQFEGSHKKVVVESVRRFKGLESKVVILYNPEFRVKNNKYIKELLYTAFSRCSCYLVVITTKEGLTGLKSVEGVSVDDLDNGGDEMDMDDKDDHDDDGDSSILFENQHPRAPNSQKLPFECTPQAVASLKEPHSENITDTQDYSGPSSLTRDHIK